MRQPSSIQLSPSSTSTTLSYLNDPTPTPNNQTSAAATAAFSSFLSELQNTTDFLSPSNTDAYTYPFDGPEGAGTWTIKAIISTYSPFTWYVLWHLLHNCRLDLLEHHSDRTAHVLDDRYIYNYPQRGPTEIILRMTGGGSTYGPRDRTWGSVSEIVRPGLDGFVDYVDERHRPMGATKAVVRDAQGEDVAIIEIVRAAGGSGTS